MVMKVLLENADYKLDIALGKVTVFNVHIQSKLL